MENIDFTTQDGFVLKGNVFKPQPPNVNAAKAGIIINSATAVGKGYYRAFAQHLAEHGYLVITYDYRGIGESKATKNTHSKLSMLAWGEQDFEAVINAAVKNHPDLNWHCIGHSVGGQIVGLAPSNSKLTSVYCVAAQNGYWKNWGLPQTPKILLSWYGLIPFFSKTLGYVPGFMLGGTSLPGPIAQEWARWCTNPNFISDKKGKPIRTHFNQFESKMRFLAIKDDLNFAPLKAVKELGKFYSQADKEIKVVDPKEFGIKEIGHFGFFKRQHKDALWPNAIEWFGQFS